MSTIVDNEEVEIETDGQLESEDNEEIEEGEENE